MNTEAKKQAIQHVVYRLHSQTEEGRNLQTTEAKLIHFSSKFKSEYQWQIERNGLQVALCEYLQGLGGAIDLEYWNSDILELGIRWGHLKESDTESKKLKFVDNWFNATASILIKLMKQFNL